MSSTRVPVVLRGVLRGNGHEADCVVQAIQVSLPRSGDFDYSQFNITSVAKTLPPGLYELEVAGRIFPVRQSPLGPWLAVE